MKKLLIASYAGYDVDDPEEITTNTWTVGMYDGDDEKSLINDANNEFVKFIDEQIENRFDDEDADEETLEEIEYFRNSFEVTIYQSRGEDQRMETNLVGELYKDGEYYYESLKLYVITLEA